MKTNYMYRDGMTLELKQEVYNRLIDDNLRMYTVIKNLRTFLLEEIQDEKDKQNKGWRDAVEAYECVLSWVERSEPNGKDTSKT